MRQINVNITDVAKMWRGSLLTPCGKVIKAVARLHVARLPCGEVTRIGTDYVYATAISCVRPQA